MKISELIGYAWPINKWRPYVREKWPKINPNDPNEIEVPRYVRDCSTRNLYENLPVKALRYYFIAATVLVPFLYTAVAICSVSYRALRLISLYNFWKRDVPPYSFKARLFDTGKDVVKLILAPIAIVRLESASIFGLISPNDGRKQFANVEKETFEFVIFKPFHPVKEIPPKTTV